MPEIFCDAHECCDSASDMKSSCWHQKFDIKIWVLTNLLAKTVNVVVKIGPPWIETHFVRPI